MERLSGLDASFLYGETPETPTHTTPLWIFEPIPQGKSAFESFREHIRARLHLLPFFHRKLVLSPIQPDHPVWIDDDDIDLDYHVRLVALPIPGTDQQLRTLVSRLHMILAEHISCDRNTLREMLKRMSSRKLIAKRNNPEDRRSIQVHITTKGEAALLSVVPAAAKLQELLLVPLRKEDRAHFLKCLLVISKAPVNAEPRLHSASK